MSGKLWTEYELQYLRGSYYSNPDDLALHLNRSSKAIKNKAQRLGVARSKAPHLNHGYFTNLNEDNCYWAGFIAADGSLPINRKQVVVNLADCDAQHLETLKKSLAFEGQVYKREYGGISFVSLLIPSQVIYEDLQRNFNITPQKSLTLMPPPLKDEQLIRAFIRGYFDGDGCFSTSLSFAGTVEMLSWIRLCLSEYTYRNINQTIRLAGNIAILEYGGRVQKNIIADWLYNGSKPSTRLGRKYDKRMESALLA
jgi:hypothetical protein